MKAEIICVGTELLLGDVLNTNSQFLARELKELGYDVYRHTNVGDNKERLKAAIAEALARVDLIVLTGGLGPTKDDLTKETLAEVLGQELVIHEESKRKLEEYFYQQKKAIKINLKQACFPKNAIVLNNEYGTAPGAIFIKDQKRAMILPGPPKEMKNMFEHYGKKALYLDTDFIFSKKIKIIGMGEWKMAKMADKLLDQNNPTVAPYVDGEGLYLKVTGKGHSKDLAEAMVKKTCAKIYAIFGDAIYGEDEDTLQSVLVQKLIQEKKKIATAESVTGGLIASYCIRVPGASSVLEESYITYSDTAKSNILQIQAERLKKYGAVSKEICEDMAIGLFQRATCDYAIVSTGFAGPNDKEVGLVYLGIYDGKKVWVEEKRYSGERNMIRHRAAKDALNMLRKIMTKNVSRETFFL